MQISKAIEILELNLKQTGKAMPHDCRDAVALATEALKRVKEHRPLYAGKYPHLLPGEDSIEDPGLSDDRIQKVRESPLGREPRH